MIYGEKALHFYKANYKDIHKSVALNLQSITTNNHEMNMLKRLLGLIQCNLKSMEGRQGH